MNISRRQILLLLALALLLILTNFAVEILAPDAQAWLRENFGDRYKATLVGILIVGTLLTLLISDWQNWFKKAAHDAVNTLELSLQDELIANLKAKYQKRIDSKLAGRFPVNLRINASNTGTSEETAQSFITLQDEEVGHEIGEIFERAKGRLLIVGLPGAGKTTLLLQLAVELLKRAESVPATSVAANPPASSTVFPAAKAAGTIPVLLNLATWRTEFATFEEWLKRILPNELGASKAMAEKIRANIPLVLLLDGLDEVPEADRNSCLEALGQYGIKPGHQFALSSRIEEYAKAKDAPVYGQVEVAPLTATQIEQNLLAYSGLTPEAKPLLNAIQKDPLLKEAIENPFYLNTAQLLFASGKNWSEFGFVATDVAGRQQELVERFVGYALGHKVKREYKPEKVKKWLGFLAGKMEAGGLRVFELVDLQPPNNSRYMLILLLITGLILGLFAGFLISFLGLYHEKSITLIAFGPLIGISIGLILGFEIWLLESLYDFLLPPDYKEKLNLIKQRSRKDWLRGTIATTDIRIWSKQLFFQGLLEVSLVFPAFWIVSTIIIYVEDYPNMVFFITDLKKASILLAMICLGGFVLMGMLGRWYIEDRFLSIAHPYQRISASYKNLNFNGFKHIALRLFFALQSSLPLRLVHFLNEMSRRHLLEFDGNLDTETGGGSWRWRHRIIQEHFLTMNDERVTFFALTGYKKTFIVHRS